MVMEIVTRSKLQQFRLNVAGVSAVEFALLAPLLIMIYFGLAESTQLMLAERRISQVAYSVGDLVSRTDQIDDAEMADIFSVAKVIMEPFPVSTVLGIRVTSVAILENGQSRAVWSDATGTMRAHPPDMPVTLEANSVKPGETVVISEVSYLYRGLSTLVLTDGMVLQGKFYHRPRKSDAVIRIKS